MRAVLSEELTDKLDAEALLAETKQEAHDRRTHFARGFSED